MRTKLITFTTILFLLATTISAQQRGDIVASGYCGIATSTVQSPDDFGKNLKWTISLIDSCGELPNPPERYRLTLSGQGEMYAGLYNSSVNNYLWGKYSDAVYELVVEEGVTSINVAFFSSYYENNSRYYGSMPNLASVLIPESLTDVVRANGTPFRTTNIQTPIYNSHLFICLPENYIGEYTIPDGITSIGDQAFSYCYQLTAVHLPESVTCIGDSTFVYCRFTSITIPSGVTKIGQSAFRNCNNLMNVTISDGVQSIDLQAFAGCTSLTSITIPGSVTEIGQSAFVDCDGLMNLTISDGVESIGESAFYECRDLTSIYIPKSVTEIGDGAFKTCGYFERNTALTSLICLSDADYDWTNDVMYFAPDLTNAILPAFDLDEADNSYMPRNIKQLTFITGEISDNLALFIARQNKTLRHLDISGTHNITLSDEIFYNCYHLDTLLLPAQLENVPYKMAAECVSLKTITIPASVSEIDDRAFEDCRMLTEIIFEKEIPTPQAGRTAAPAAQSELRRIGNWAFYNCHQLQHLVIPEGVTEIGDAAFYGCTYLEDLELPSTVTRIGDNCFALCSKLKQIRVRAAVPPEIEAKTFFDVNREIPVYVPEDYLDDYREDPYWREFNLIGEDHGGTVGTDHTAISGLYRMEDGRIVLTEEMPVSVYAATGALVYSGTTTEVALPAPGVYLLRIGGETVKVVRP